MGIMTSHPESFKDCIKRDAFEVQNKFNDGKFEHIEKKLERLHDEAIHDVTNLRKDIEKDISKLKDEVQKEINYKNKSNRDLIIYISGGLGALMGTMWAKIMFIENNLNDHMGLLWHEGAGEILFGVINNVDKILCKIFNFC